MKIIQSNSRGFTLIELLVVISIISLLSSIVLMSVNSARAKARDARKQADFRAISTALQLFFDKNGKMPANYLPGSGQCETAAYNQSMQELITGGFLSVIPKSPGGGAYCYYNYGSGNKIGAFLKTVLETAPNTTTGIPPSCRPFSGSNWCRDDVSDKQYCICNLY